MKPGNVSAVRELDGGRPRVQAKVVVAMDSKHGSAVVTVETHSPEVMKALADLKAAIRNEGRQMMADILEGQKAWDQS